MMNRLVMAIFRLSAVLRYVLELKLQASIINSYAKGIGLAGEKRARLEGCSNIGRNDTNEGKGNDATKSSELYTCVS